MVRWHVLHREAEETLQLLDTLLAKDWVHLPSPQNNRMTDSLLNRLYDLIWDLELGSQQLARSRSSDVTALVFALRRFRERLAEWARAF